ncbi:MAG: hypothetical protein SNG02_00400 [Rikenellaceae bacterium]
MSLYYVNSTMFSHVHVIDGATIIHSHFHGDDHTQSEDGDHTASEITLIQHLNNATIIISETLSLDNIYSVGEYHPFVPSTFEAPEVDPYRNISPRAPPRYTL